MSPQHRFSGLETPRLRIRHFANDDLPTLMAYRNDAESIKFQKWDSMTEDFARIFIDEMKDASPGLPGYWFQFALELKATHTHIGDCALHTHGADARLGEIGYTIAPAYRGQGYATEAVVAVLDYAFRVLRMHRLSATVDVLNVRSIALLEWIGFRREGHLVSCAWFRDGWCDEFIYAMLCEEWAGRRESVMGRET
jgi:RimJ/RimL family protein N-acetyltransferase